MGSRKEEERNEKIIRGLMKLPPNRRCINCNSLGPQYVCTNFWTFVCITCSGIHREFTHRVKSVSMSKFTSQEVEALQNGGNQRARDIYLRDWDQQRQRLPGNSNVDKVRDFIKSVYVDRRYAGVKASEKPPRDLQSLRSPEDEMRRANSYHSYSQSPPYDFQYEDRRYGKQATTLTRKPGSDRSIYVGKMSSFICSPTRLSEKTLEDRFANEGSVSRVSEYSVSSGGDQVRSGAESPNFQKDIAFSSPPYQHPGDVLTEDMKLQTINSFSDTSTKIDANGFPHPQSAASASHGSMDASRVPALPESGSSASNIDLFQLPERSVAPSVDLFQMPQLEPAPSMSLHQPFQTTSPSTFDLFSGIYQQQQATSVGIISSESPAPKNEGWATFDIPQPATSTLGTGCLTPSAIPSNIVSSTTVDQMSSPNANMKWPQVQTSISQASDPWWKEGLQIGQAVSSNGSAQVNSAPFELQWNAFDNSSAHFAMEETSEPQVAPFIPLSAAATNQFLGVEVSEDFTKNVIQRPFSHLPFPDHNALGDIGMGSSYESYLVEDTRMHGGHVSTNPFDISFESNSEPNNMFLDMSSLQAALPDGQLPTTFLDGVNQPWFPPDPMITYVPGPSQGGLAYVAGQAANPQLASVQTQEPVASIGGNPFA